MKERVQLFTQRFGDSDDQFATAINEWLAAQPGELIDAKLVIETAMQAATVGGTTRMAKVHKIVLLTWRPLDADGEQ